MTQLPTDRSEADSVAEHTSDHNILNAQHNELDGHAADTTAVHGITNTANLATQTDVTAAINGLVDAAPGTLDTLNELAAALGDDANYASTVTTALAGKASTSHHTTHEPGGSDAMASDATAATASLRTIGTGATQAAAGNHAHSGTSVAFTPTGGIAATDVSGALAELDTEKETAGVAIPKSLVDAAGDLLVGTADNTVGRLAKGSALQVLRVNSGATALEYADPSGGGGLALYGDGSDGVVDFDGTTARLGLTPSGGVYTLTRDIFLAGGSQVSGTATVDAGGSRIFCRGTLTVGASATIRNAGIAGSASGGGGAAASSAVLGGGTAGGAGQAAAGIAGTNGSNNAGGRGGSGGLGSSGAGAAAGTIGTISAAVGGGGVVRALPNALSGTMLATSGNARFTGGTGGGGAGGDGTAGGGGGGGGGILVVAAQTITNSGTIQANGGNGGSPPSGNRGGGGGGGGGVAILIYNTFSGNTATANGGTGGTHTGTGVDGSNGSAGVVVTLVNA